MVIKIKNMVCSRCKMVVQAEVEKVGLSALSVELGEVTLKAEPTQAQLQLLNDSFKSLGFEIIDDRKVATIEKIKNVIISLIHHSAEPLEINLSDFITSHIHQDYNYLSNLFSEVESTTIEKYFIAQRIERAKELLVYNELSLSEIAFQLGYSSVAHLSSQFKKITGLTPSHFKSLKEHKRRNIEDL